MANYTGQTMPYADNATITTPLSGCDSIVNLTQTIQDLYYFYQNSKFNLNSSVFHNISIINFDCNIASGKYFQQIITFTSSVSIRIQAAVASVYFDYIHSNAYFLNGFHVDPEDSFTLSSITLNNSAQYSVCLSAEVAQEVLCPFNSSTPLCIDSFDNPWIFNCSNNATTSTISSLSTTNNDQFLSTTISSSITSWQIGMICGISVLFLVFFFLLIGYFVRRYSRSKRVTFSSENLFDDTKSKQKSGIPQVQAFQRTTTMVQPRQSTHTAISQMQNGIATNINKKNRIDLRPPGPYNQRTFINHAKVRDPVFSSTVPQTLNKPVYIPTNHINTITPKVYSTTVISRPVSGTSTSQLRSITDGLEENTLDESDSISLDRLNSANQKKPSTPVSRQLTNMSFIDESLHDEDAWMPILAVANAELDVLNRLENEQNQIKTIM